MINELGYVILGIFAVNGLVTYQGFQNNVFFEKYLFQVNKILGEKDYFRLFSSGFLHGSWMHFAFNMYTLYFFSLFVRNNLGDTSLLFVYLISLLGGNILSLAMHRKHLHYRAVGASGAVNGLIFSAIALDPNITLGIFGIIPVPGWAFALGYTLYTIYGIKSQKDNIGHEAHLGGGIIGLLATILLKPAVLDTSLFPIAITLIPSLGFLAYFLFKSLNIRSTKPSIKKGVETIDDRYNQKRIDNQKELNYLLEKISQTGISSLSQYEQSRLDELSKK